MKIKDAMPYEECKDTNESIFVLICMCVCLYTIVLRAEFILSKSNMYYIVCVLYASAIII